MSDDEEKRIKLEEARKRVEELRKKKKNKNKKKKESKKEDKGEDADVSTEVTAEPVAEGTSEPLEPAESVDLSQPTEPTESGTGMDAGVDAAVEGSIQPEKEQPNLEHVEDGQTKEIESAQPVLEADSGTATTAEAKEVVAEEGNEDGDDDTSKAKELEQTVESANDRSAEGSSSEKQDSDELQFDDDNVAEGDFLTTIKKAKEEQEITNLKQQIEDLSAEIKKLKFLNIDRESTIEDLETELQSTKEELSRTKAELETVKEENARLRKELEDSEMKLRNADRSPTIQFSDFNSPVLPAAKTAGSGSFGHGFQDIQTHSVDRVVLDQWRNWDIDMTTWRSIGTGPIIEF